MKSIKFLFSTTLTSALLLSTVGCSTPTEAPGQSVVDRAYAVDGSSSSLTFVTTKNANVSEVQQFKRFTGTIAPSGTVSLSIDLASVETNIPIRNERMQEMLFEVPQFGAARFEASIDPVTVHALKTGESLDTDVAGKLTLHGLTQDSRASLRVVRLSGDRLLVVTRAPILVNASSFGLAGGIERLRAIAGLTSISGVVPVTLSLVFIH